MVTLSCYILEERRLIKRRFSLANRANNISEPKSNQVKRSLPEAQRNFDSPTTSAEPSVNPTETGIQIAGQPTNVGPSLRSGQYRRIQILQFVQPPPFPFAWAFWLPSTLQSTDGLLYRPGGFPGSFRFEEPIEVPDLHAFVNLGRKKHIGSLPVSEMARFNRVFASVLPSNRMQLRAYDYKTWAGNVLRSLQDGGFVAQDITFREIKKSFRLPPHHRNMEIPQRGKFFRPLP